MKTGNVVIKLPEKIKMTVRSVKGTEVICDWFKPKGDSYEGKLYQETFNKDELVVIQE